MTLLKYRPLATDSWQFHADHVYHFEFITDGLREIMRKSPDYASLKP